MTNISNIERSFWDIYTNVLPDDDLKPVNLDQEKAEFFQSIKEGREYNPVFEYRKTDNIKYLDALLEVAKDASEFGSYTGTQYVFHCEKLYDWITKFSSKDSDFGAWLYDLYGKPDASTVESAKRELSRIGYLHVEPETSTAMDAKEYFEGVLKEYGFSGWKIKYESMPAKIRISSAERTIFIDGKSRFTSRELSRLAVHEIGTHVVRYENGSKQDLMIFRFGFPNYLECEEGLAIYSEDVSGNLSDYDIGKYCLRVIASELAQHCSFHEVFSSISKQIESEQAFAITARVKRGLGDTSQPFGYSKDQLYFSGYLKVRELKTAELTKLYSGKIGFSQLHDSEFTGKTNPEQFVPEWITA